MGLDNGAVRIPNFKIRPIQMMRPDDRNIPLRVLQEEELGHSATYVRWRQQRGGISTI
jgi:hypothetical protein